MKRGAIRGERRVLQKSDALSQARSDAVDSIRCPAARQIKHSAGAERAVLRAEPGNHGGNFFLAPKTVHRNPGSHVLNVTLRNAVEDFGLDDGRRDAIDQDAGFGQFFA